MSKKNKLFHLTEMESVHQDNTPHLSANLNRRQYHGEERADPGFLGYLTEGYALYAAAFYPPLLHTMEAARRSEVDLFRQAANEGHGGNAEEAGEREDAFVLPEDADARAASVQQDSVTWRALRWCGSLLLAPVRFIQREREIARSIAILSSMDDRGLRDIGMSRSEIDHMVRYGRGE
ncbi:DUF1127 domain-containing protein [Dongia sp.]|uniref:DUF1127 domain-containing protein n=1 Tax=Dongia sp. TaxID=1977262 RepID=UPI0035B1049D